MKKFLFPLWRGLESAVLLAGGVWCTGVAIWVWEFAGCRLAAWSICIAFLWLAGVFCLRARTVLWILEMSVVCSFLMLTPERQFSANKWNVECQKIAQISYLDDGKIRIGNVRDFQYRSVDDYDVRYVTLTTDVNLLESMDIAFSHWDELECVAHMLLCFNFRDGKRVAVSFEPRVPAGKRGGDFFLGIYRRYGQMMLIGTPEDLFDLRSVYRKETFYCYRTEARQEVLQRIFLRVIERAAHLEKKAEFYHSLTENCTTGLLAAINDEVSLRNWDSRMLFNGFYDKYLFEKGFLSHQKGESFGALKARSYVPGFNRKGK